MVYGMILLSVALTRKLEGIVWSVGVHNDQICIHSAINRWIGWHTLTTIKGSLFLNLVNKLELLRFLLLIISFRVIAHILLIFGPWGDLWIFAWNWHSHWVFQLRVCHALISSLVRSQPLLCLLRLIAMTIVELIRVHKSMWWIMSCWPASPSSYEHRWRNNSCCLLLRCSLNHYVSLRSVIINDLSEGIFHAYGKLSPRGVKAAVILLNEIVMLIVGVRASHELIHKGRCCSVMMLHVVNLNII